MLNQPAAANAHHLASPFPGPQPWEVARSATCDAAGNEAVAHRDERIARGGRTIACNGTESAQHRGIPFGRRQPDHGEPRPLATRSGTPPRVDREGAAMVAILVALC
jgi:hypothetical protein